MPLPSAWTENSLAAQLESEVEGVLDDLGLGDTDLLATAAGKDVPRVLGIRDVADVDYSAFSNVVKVLTIAIWCAWQRAYDKSLPSTDLVAGSATLKDSQTFDHLKERLAAAERAASQYTEVAALISGGANTAYVTSLSTAGSPYPFPAWNQWG